VEFAEYRDDLVLRDQPLGRGAALGRHAAGVGVDDLHLAPQDAAGGVDFLGCQHRGVLHVGALGVAARRRQRADPADHDRLGRACPPPEQRQRGGRTGTRQRGAATDGGASAG